MSCGSAAGMYDQTRHTVAMLPPLRTVGTVMSEPPKPARRLLHIPEKQLCWSHVCGRKATLGISSSGIAATTPQVGNISTKGFDVNISQHYCSYDTASEVANDLYLFELRAERSRYETSNLLASQHGASAHSRASTPLECHSQGSSEGAPRLRRDTVSSLLPCLSSDMFLQRNNIAEQLRKMDKTYVVQKVRAEGRRLGMREVSLQEFTYLLSCLLDEETLDKNEVRYLFRFLYWNTQETISFEDLIASMSLLFARVEILILVQCKYIMEERPLDNSVIALVDLDAMLASIKAVFTERVPEVCQLCDHVRCALESFAPCYAVPAAAFRVVVRRHKLLVDCLNVVRMDGAIDWLPLLQLLDRVPEDGHEDLGTTRQELRQKVVDTAVGKWRKNSPAPVSDDGNSCSLDLFHPKLITDKYVRRACSA